jgi:hypothetical protein
VDWYDAAGEYDKRTFEQGGRLSSLPFEWQRELVALKQVNRDVSNGGYLQFLVNGGRESYVYASQSLKKIGAHKMGDLIDRCQALIDEHFPSDGKTFDELEQLLPNPVIDCEGRVSKDAGSVLPEPVLEQLRQLSYEFMDYPDAVQDLAQSYYGPLIDSDRPNWDLSQLPTLGDTLP